jgi:ribosomal protein S18 acetylase RimI-like enzyme
MCAGCGERGPRAMPRPTTNKPSIVPLLARDAGELLTLQRAAYTTEGQIYGDPFIPPLTQTLEELAQELRDAALALKAVLGTRMVGAVRAHLDGTTARIGRLMVAPDLQGQGIGTQLVRAAENALADQVERFELFTGNGNPANMRLYLRIGYRERRSEDAGNGLTLVHLDKSANPGRAR